MKKISRLFLVIIAVSALFLAPQKSSATSADTLGDWYIKNYDSEIVVNKDSSLLITEKITADCGNLSNKHGIYRSLPTFYQKTSTEKVSTPIELVSITDFNNNSLKYSTSKSDGIVTWKIGDEDKTVSGVNYYKITYKVKNAIRFDNGNFDEFYWNLIGNYWQIQIDAASTKIQFPAEITKNNVTTSIYTGYQSQQGKDATLNWIDDNNLLVTSNKIIKPTYGMTLSATFPKNVISPHVPTWWEKYGADLIYLLPILTFIICFIFWRKNGVDPKVRKAIIAEYEPPEKMTPLQMEAISRGNKIGNRAISAEIINLAVKKYISIEEIAGKGLFRSKDYKFKLLQSNFNNDQSLTNSEEQLLSSLFSGQNEILLSDLKNKFYSKISAVTDKVKNEKIVADSFDQKSFKTRKLLSLLVPVILIIIGLTTNYLKSHGAIDTSDQYNAYSISIFLAGAIFITFIVLISKATPYGAELQWKIKGFKLYMQTAEKYREQFNEKEDIFEKYLPYAIVFGIVGLWAKKMMVIYGDDYFSHYHPMWYLGSVDDFDFDNFSKSINDLSSSMAATISSSPSSSGAGGGGFSGGGGGGGGGGGW